MRRPWEWRVAWRRLEAIGHAEVYRVVVQFDGGMVVSWRGVIGYCQELARGQGQRGIFTDFRWVDEGGGVWGIDKEAFVWEAEDGKEVTICRPFPPNPIRPECDILGLDQGGSRP